MCVSLQGNEQSSGGLVKQADNLKLPKHFPYHRDLLPYKDLTLWLKVADKTKYMQLCDVRYRELYFWDCCWIIHVVCQIYTQSLNKVYSREITGFIESAKQRFIEKGEQHKHYEVESHVFFAVVLYS